MPECVEHGELPLSEFYLRANGTKPRDRKCKECVRNERTYSGIVCPSCGGRKDGTAKLCAGCVELRHAYKGSAPTFDDEPACLGSEDFDSNGNRVAAQQAVCLFKCPVQKSCLAHALKDGIEAEFGVWGGLSAPQRREIAAADESHKLSLIKAKLAEAFDAAEMHVENKRKCPRCGEAKSVKQFYTFKRGVQGMCRECTSIDNRVRAERRAGKS